MQPISRNADGHAIYDTTSPQATAGYCGSCGARIFWIHNENGQYMPINEEGVSHFTDCPNASQHSKKRRRKPDKNQPSLFDGIT